MTLEEKIQCVKDNKDSAVAALNTVLDKIYEINDKFFENGKLKEGLKKDEMVETQFQDLLKDAEKYESVRQKILTDDFNLSLLEINYVALSFIYLKTYWKQMIRKLSKAIDEADNLMKVLMDKKS